MSNWTHVAGIVRVDGLRLAGMDEPNFDELFGKELEYEGDWEDYELHSELYLPAGSEGSLKKSVWVNPDESYIAAYTVSIFGDLRDHDDPNEIVEWFKEKLKNVLVRNATITVENERNGTVNWTWKDEDTNID